MVSFKGIRLAILLIPKP